MIYEYFRVTGANDSVENYADLFTIVLRNDDIQEFDSKWDGILLSMTKIPSDDILKELYKLIVRESEKLKTVLELFDLEIHQKKTGPDYQRLKTLVKRNIEQNPRNKNIEVRNGNYERNVMVKNQGTKQRGQKKYRRMLAMENQLTMFLKETIAHFPSQYFFACKKNTAESVSKFFHASEKCVVNPKFQMQESQ